MRSGKNSYECDVNFNGAGKYFVKQDDQKEANDDMSKLVGANQALLDFVVFSHQNDSCWPLELDSGLKQRFDGIFGLDLKEREIVKTMENQKVLELELSEVRNKKTIAANVKTFSEDHKKGMTLLQGQISNLNDEIKDCGLKIYKFDEQLKHFKTTDIELSEATIEKSICDDR